MLKLAPNFSLKDKDGNVHSLEDYRGKWVVIYFYPKNNTPGCTKEACSFRDGRDMLASLGAEIIGISKDSLESHNRFSKLHKLNFTLLSDPTAETIKSYGSWKKKKFMGKEYMGISRDTFIVNPKGEIAKEYRGVNPMTHFEEVMKDLKQLISF